MEEFFAVPDYGIEDIIENDPETYVDQWVELMKGGDCVLAIQRRKANAIGKRMHSHGFTNEQVWEAFNKARTICGLLPMEMPSR